MPRDIVFTDATTNQLMSYYWNVTTNRQGGRFKDLVRVFPDAHDIGKATVVSMPSDNDTCVSYALSVISRYTDTEQGPMKHIVDEADAIAEWYVNYNMLRETLGHAPSLATIRVALNSLNPMLLTKIVIDADAGSSKMLEQRLENPNSEPFIWIKRHDNSSGVCAHAYVVIPAVHTVKSVITYTSSNATIHQAPQVRTIGQRHRYARESDFTENNEVLWKQAKDFLLGLGLQAHPHRLNQSERRVLREGLRTSKSLSPNKKDFVKDIISPSAVIVNEEVGNKEKARRLLRKMRYMHVCPDEEVSEQEKAAW